MVRTRTVHVCLDTHELCVSVRQRCFQFFQGAVPLPTTHTGAAILSCSHGEIVTKSKIEALSLSSIIIIL